MASMKRASCRSVLFPATAQYTPEQGNRQERTLARPSWAPWLLANFAHGGKEVRAASKNRGCHAPSDSACW